MNIPGYQAGYNPQSNCKSGRRLQNRVVLLDWSLGVSEVSLKLNLETNEESMNGTKLPCKTEKRHCQSTALTKATKVWEPETRRQLFEKIWFDAFLVKYHDRYWIETNSDWTIVQELNDNHTKVNKTDSQITTRFKIYSKTEFQCGSTKPLHSTEYEDFYIFFELAINMNTGKSNLLTKTLIILKTINSLKYPPKI